MAKLTHKKRLNTKRVTRKKSRKVQRAGARGPRTGVLVNLNRIRSKNPNPYVLEMNEDETHNVFGPNPVSVVKKASSQTMGQKMSRFGSSVRGKMGSMGSSVRGKMGSMGSSMRRGFSSIKDRFSRKKSTGTPSAIAVNPLNPSAQAQAQDSTTN
jgi:hypothetical protein